MSRQIAKQTLQTEPGDQQRAASSGRCRESLQGDDEPQTERHGRPRAQLRQLQFAAAQGTIIDTQLLRRGVPE